MTTRLTPKIRRLLIEAADSSTGRLRISLDSGHPSTRFALIGHGLAKCRFINDAVGMFITAKGLTAIGREPDKRGMFLFAELLVEAAEQAGIKVPPDPEEWEVLSEEYPHFYVFCACQLERPMQPGEHWENAKVIASIPTDQLRKMKIGDFRRAGVKGL
jgi:hypothetical protein